MYTNFMAASFKKKFLGKKLIVFDMDGTLTPSKSPMKKDMVRLLAKLLEKIPVAVIGGGRYEQFRRQFVGKARFKKKLLKKLFLFPTSSTAFYRWRNGSTKLTAGGWKKVYAYELSRDVKKKIFKAFREVFGETGYKRPDKVYGKVIENRGTQITFSAVGQGVVDVLGAKRGVRIKEDWKKKNNKLRLRMAKLLAKKLPDLEVRVGGLTSIDVTKKGIDKAYGIRQIEKVLRVKIKDMLFVGDAIFPGGNDYAVVRTGVDYILVSGPAETKKFIQFLIKSARFDNGKRIRVK